MQEQTKLTEPRPAALAFSESLSASSPATAVRFKRPQALELLLRVERMGTFRYLERLMAKHGERLRSSEDPDVVAAFDSLSARLVTALEFERLSGDGSLIDLADPVVVNLVRRGREITPKQVEAAKRRQYAGADGASASSSA